MASPRLVFLLGFIYLATREDTACDSAKSLNANEGIADSNSKFAQFDLYENHVLGVAR